MVLPDEREIGLKLGCEIETIERVLRARAVQQHSIGQDGAPTRQQVRHWQMHQNAADDKCPFCQHEKRLFRERKALLQAMTPEEIGL